MVQRAHTLNKQVTKNISEYLPAILSNILYRTQVQSYGSRTSLRIRCSVHSIHQLHSNVLVQTDVEEIRLTRTSGRIGATGS